MSQELNKGTQHWSSLVGHKKHFPFFFYEFDIYFIVLLWYFYNNSNKPIIIIKTRTYIPGIKSVTLKGAWIFEMETFDVPLSAEMILISKTLAAGMKWWWILELWKLSADEYLSSIENFVIWFWTSSILILIKIIPGILLTYQSYIKSIFKMRLFWKLEWVIKHLALPPIPSQGLLPWLAARNITWHSTEGHLDGELDLLNFWNSCTGMDLHH